MFKYLRRLGSHVTLVVSEFLYGVIRLKQPVTVAANFFVMRLLTPFGLFRAWDRRGLGSSDPYVAALAQSGFTLLAPLAPPTVDALVTYFCRHADAGEGRVYDGIGDYFDTYRARVVQRPRGLLATGADDDALTRIALDDRFVDLAAAFLGISRSRVVASASIDALIRLDTAPPARGYDDALAFHRDIDSYRFVKIFAYLTDVVRDGGHHEIFLHSQGPSLALGPISRYSDVEIAAAFPGASLRQVTGAAGTIFAENTFAFHRGTRPRVADRLILNLIYMENTFHSRYPETFPVRPQTMLAAA